MGVPLKPQEQMDAKGAIYAFCFAKNFLNCGTQIALLRCPAWTQASSPRACNFVFFHLENASRDANVLLLIRCYDRFRSPHPRWKLTNSVDTRDALGLAADANLKPMSPPYIVFEGIRCS